MASNVSCKMFAGDYIDDIAMQLSNYLSSNGIMRNDIIDTHIVSYQGGYKLVLIYKNGD